VHAIDFSAAALEKARRLAGERGVTLEIEQVDVLDWIWPEAAYDLVAAIFIQFAPPPGRDRIIAGIRRTLKPGGLLILQGYTPKQIEFGTGGPPHAANMYTADLLREWFGDWETLHLAEHESFISEGTHLTACRRWSTWSRKSRPDRAPRLPRGCRVAPGPMPW
jgi:SAM-dependent methyltransferase